MNTPLAAPQKTLVLVDGSSYLYRAFHAMPDLRVDRSDPNSAPTGAVRGMINMMQALAKEIQSDYAVCIFDAPGPTFRDEIYPQYKAQRAPMPDDLRAQIEPIHEVVKLMGWPVMAVKGVEADDVIGTLAKLGAQQGFNVMISSGDKDLSQLVEPSITVVDTMNGKRRDVAGVTAEFGVPPELMVDYQTLVGDTVDNVPGVAKVGPKTAAKWLVEYGSLDNLLANALDIKGVAGQNLREAVDWLPTGRSLVTIKTDCDLAAEIASWPDLAALAKHTPDEQALSAFYARMGFKSLINKGTVAQSAKPAAAKKAAGGTSGSLFDDDSTGEGSGAASVGEADGLDPAAANSSVTGPLTYTTVLTAEALQSWVTKLMAAPLVAVDTETNALDPMTAELVGISVCITPGEAAYIPVGHNYPDAPAQLPAQHVLDALRPWLESAEHHKLGQHVKFDRHIFANCGVQVRGYVHDTMLQSYVLEVHRPHGLESLAKRHVGRTGLSFEDLCGKGVNQITMAQVAVDTASQYACEDADMCLDVHLHLYPKLKSFAGLKRIYELEMASSEALFRIERNGVLIDGPTLAKQSNELGARIVALEAKAHELAQQPFNLGSPKQIGEIFFTKLGLPVVKKTATGAPSTDEEVLEKLAADYPLPACILEYRGLAKLKSTYTDKLAGLANAKTGRVHTHYAQAVAVTGRLSSNEPNLQNIPVRTEEGRRVREAFVAPAGRMIASADYSQIELRIMAHLSEDQALIHAFKEGLDVHRATAAEIFNVGLDQVTSEQRRYAKVINFGLIYGMSAFGLAKNLGIDNTAAKNYIQTYFERYPGVRQYMEETREQAKAQGFVETVFGRRLYLPEINSPNGPRRAGAERAAINAPMQGTAADLIKMSMLKVQEALDQANNGVIMIMQVHDELVFELPLEQADWVREQVPKLMADVAQLRVPLLAEVGMGANWEQAH
jgi:DNA polymerase I